MLLLPEGGQHGGDAVGETDSRGLDGGGRGGDGCQGAQIPLEVLVIGGVGRPRDADDGGQLLGGAHDDEGVGGAHDGVGVGGVEGLEGLVGAERLPGRLLHQRKTPALWQRKAPVLWQRKTPALCPRGDTTQE